jgi:hypothetical protein
MPIAVATGPLLAILLIGAIMCRTKITVQSGAKRHPEDASAANALDGDLGRLNARSPGGWQLLQGARQR